MYKLYHPESTGLGSVLGGGGGGGGGGGEVHGTGGTCVQVVYLGVHVYR